jgi:hypothetical protein
LAWRSSAAAPPASACANKLMQLLENEPELTEKLGEVPSAVIERAKPRERTCSRGQT